jgi:hypothetical protein
MVHHIECADFYHDINILEFGIFQIISNKYKSQNLSLTYMIRTIPSWLEGLETNRIATALRDIAEECRRSEGNLQTFKRRLYEHGLIPCSIEDDDVEKAWLKIPLRDRKWLMSMNQSKKTGSQERRRVSNQKSAKSTSFSGYKRNIEEEDIMDYINRNAKEEKYLFWLKFYSKFKEDSLSKANKHRYHVTYNRKHKSHLESQLQVDSSCIVSNRSITHVHRLALVEKQMWKKTVVTIRTRLLMTRFDTARVLF